MTDSMDTASLAGADYSSSIPDAVVATTSIPTTEDSILARRYARLAKKKEGLVFEFTRDPALIHQFYRIYEDEFKAVLNVTSHHDEEDEHDRRGHLLIVRRGNFCVGGALISVTTPRQPHPLPIEINGFKLENHFPHLSLKEMRYGQVGRFCLLPEFRGGDVTREMQRHITRKALALNLEMFFAVAPVVNARVYKQNCLAIGFKDVQTHFDIELPSYPGYEEVKLCLISGVIDKTLTKEPAAEPLIQNASLEKV